MSVDVYINCDGNCLEAAQFYAEVFQTEQPQIMTFGEAPPNPLLPQSEEAKELVMHTRLNISGSNVRFQMFHLRFPIPVLLKVFNYFSQKYIIQNPTSGDLQEKR